MAKAIKAERKLKRQDLLARVISKLGNLASDILEESLGILVKRDIVQLNPPYVANLSAFEYTRDEYEYLP
jgi:hypothetical protein